jgi:hypothetical protein
MTLLPKSFFSIYALKHPIRRIGFLVLIILTLLTVLLIGINYFWISTPTPEIAKHTVQQQVVPAIKVNEPSAPPLTKAAVEELIARASDDKYLHDVLGDKSASKLLPLPTHHITLQPAQQVMALSAKLDNSLPSVAKSNPLAADRAAVTVQRCTYQQQSYVIGDIVKTPQGWVRCTPVVAVAGSASSSLVWTAVTS